MYRRGLMLVLSSPSGAGKTSIVHNLLKVEPELVMSVSVTTRPQRTNEIDGKDYHFISLDSYQNMLKNEELLEYAEVYGNFYGTLRKTVFDTLEKGIDIVFDIDWQGTQQLAQLAKTDLVSVFILPPSIEELEKRLKGRALDSEEVMKKRMAEASFDLSHWAEYDYVVINNDLNKSVESVRSILQSERLKRIRQPGLVNFVNNLRNIKNT